MSKALEIQQDNQLPLFTNSWPICPWLAWTVEISVYKSFNAKQKFHLYPRGFFNPNPMNFQP